MTAATISVPRFTPPPPPRVRGYSRSLYYHEPDRLAASLALAYYIEHHGPATPQLIEAVTRYSVAVRVVRLSGGRGGEPRSMAAALLYYSLAATGSHVEWREIYRGVGAKKQTAYPALRRLVEALGHDGLFYRLLLGGLARISVRPTSQGRVIIARAPALLVARRGPWVSWERLAWSRTVRPPGGVEVEAYGLPEALL